MLEQVIRALREAERSETRPEEKGKLRATIDYLVGAGSDIAVGAVVPSRRPAELKGQLRENPSQARALGGSQKCDLLQPLHAPLPRLRVVPVILEAGG